MTSRATAALWRLEVRKMARSAVARVASLATVVLVSGTTVGGYAAATRAPDTDVGRKSAAVLAAPGWDGYVGLATLGTGVSMLLATGVVMAWVMGREFTDGTVVGLMALPLRRGTIPLVKIVAGLGWVLVVSCQLAVLLPLGGLLLGLPWAGALDAAGVVLLVTALLGVGAMPVTWVATHWRGYLPGIGATLGLVVVTNVAAGFGLGEVLPWSVPVLWSTPGTSISTALLGMPVLVGVAAAAATALAWRRLQLGRA